MNKVLFPHITWWLLLLIPFTFFGFYPSYFSKLSATDITFHVHAFFMIVWIAMAIIQPVLIKQKNTKLHRLIGKASYFIMPCVFITAWLVIRHVYYLQIEKHEAENRVAGATVLNAAEISAKAADYIAIGIVYLAWLMIYYLLAVINRKRMLFHATYMFAAILTLLGPTVDRLIFFVLELLGWRITFFAMNFIFIFNLSLLAALLIYQWRKGNTVKPAGTALGIYIAGLLVFFFLPKTQFWNSFVNLII
jgi:uncharacterized membrane protein